MYLTKFDPFSSLQTFDDSLNRLFNEPASARPWTPSVDILETQNELILKADLPGIELKDIEISVEDKTLTLKGERKFETHEGGKNEGYHRIERSYGSFVRYFTLADTVDTEKVKADYKNGELTLTLPKKEAAKPRTIKVEVTH
jgi:HSP20 family protein